MATSLEARARRLATAVMRARTAFAASRERPPSVHNIVTSTYFDFLPVELIVDIFSQVNLADLLSLRLTSHAFQMIIDENEGAIARRFIPINRLDILTRLFPPPILRTTGVQRYSLRYLTQLKKREYLCSELSGFLAERIVEQRLSDNSNMMMGGKKRRKEVVLDVTRRVKSILTSRMYFVCFFMSTHSQERKRLMESLAIDYDQSGVLLPPNEQRTLNIRSQISIISVFDSADLVTTHHTMTLLVQHMRLATAPEPPHFKNDEWISMLLHQSGMQRIVEFFAADGPKAPRALRMAFIKRMQNDWDELEKRSINDKPPPIREFWFDAALEAMSKRGLIPHSPDLVAVPQLGVFVNIGCTKCLQSGQ